MSLGVNRFCFSLSGHCGFELGFGSMVLGRWGGLYLDPPFFKIQGASAQKFWGHSSRVEPVPPRSALEFKFSRLHFRTHSRFSGGRIPGIKNIAFRRLKPTGQISAPNPGSWDCCFDRRKNPRNPYESAMHRPLPQNTSRAKATEGGIGRDT